MTIFFLGIIVLKGNSWSSFT